MLHASLNNTGSGSCGIKIRPPKKNVARTWNGTSPKRKSSSPPEINVYSPEHLRIHIRWNAGVGTLSMISSAKRTLTCPPHSQVKHHAVKRHVRSGMASHTLSVSESSQATIFCSSPPCWVFGGNSAYDLHVSNFKHEILPHSQLSDPKAPMVQGCNGNGGCYQRSSCALTFVPPYI